MAISKLNVGDSLNFQLAAGLFGERISNDSDAGVVTEIWVLRPYDSVTGTASITTQVIIAVKIEGNDKWLRPSNVKCKNKPEDQVKVGRVFEANEPAPKK